jgi:hypothetical protein
MTQAYQRAERPTVLIAEQTGGAVFFKPTSRAYTMLTESPIFPAGRAAISARPAPYRRSVLFNLKNKQQKNCDAATAVESIVPE